MEQPSSSLSLHAIEKCGSFWLSVAATVAWPTLLALSAFCYAKVTLIYSASVGGTFVARSLLGVVFQAKIAPGQLGYPPQAPGSFGCCSVFHSHSTNDRLEYHESGSGSLALFLWGYPIQKFGWVLNSTESADSSVQLARRIVKRKILEEEIIHWSKLALSLIGFAFGLVGLLKDPKSIPAAVRAMFIPGMVPDIRVFLLLSTIASVVGFLCGALVGFVSHAPSARQASRHIIPVLSLIWSLLCLASFGIGCWQVNTRRVAKQPVWPMFIYWAPAALILDLNVCGFRPLVIFAMVGVILGIIGENAVACG